MPKEPENEGREDGASEGPEKRVVKRYPNRKLYDTHERSFTSLQGIERMVRKGIDVQVIDHATGKDITDDVLAQVLRSSRRGDVELLSTMIRAPGKLAKAIVRDEDQAEELRQLREQVRALSRGLDEILGEDGDKGGGGEEAA